MGEGGTAQEKGWREGGTEGRREGGSYKGWREGEMEGGREEEGGREQGRASGKERAREGR